MFFVHYEDDSMQTEEQLVKWDNVPTDHKIKRIGVVAPIQSGSKKGFLSISPLPERCEKYCCTKLGRMTVGVDNGVMVGYAMMGAKDGIVYRVEVTAEGVGPMRMIPIEKLKVRESAWRNGC